MNEERIKSLINEYGETWDTTTEEKNDLLEYVNQLLAEQKQEIVELVKDQEKALTKQADLNGNDSGIYLRKAMTCQYLATKIEGLP